jgi:hypothetical protein
MNMRYETGTFELRDNDVMIRELSSAETNEVAGGTGFTTVSASLQAGPNSGGGTGSSASTTASGFFLAANNTAAQGNIFQTVSAVGTVALGTSSFSEVF